MMNKQSAEQPASKDIEILTIKDVAELLKVSVSSIRRLQGGRNLPFFKVGGSVRFAKSDIIEYLKRARIDVISY